MYQLALLFLLPLTTAQNFIPCKVDWVEHNFGDDLPGGLVASHPGKYYVAKVKISGRDQVGYIDQDGMAYSQGSGKFSSCSLLVNPNNCNMKWVRSDTKMSSDYFVKVGQEDIVRTSRDSEWITGYRIGHSVHWFLFWFHIRILHALGYYSDYQILTSESPGFQLKIANFKFGEDSPFDNNNIGFMGLDSIYNKSPAEVTQIVTHSKTVSESVSVTESSSFSHTKSVSATAGFSAFGFSASVTASAEWTNSNSNSKTVTQEKSTTVSVSREVRVPPLTSVQACSTLSTAENFVLEWTAEGVFTVEGMNGTEIKKIFENEEFKIPYRVKNITETAVIADINGVFRGSLAMQTKFVVVPDDSTVGCAELQDSIIRFEAARKNGTAEELKSLRSRIDKVMDEIVGAGGEIHAS